MSWVLAFLGFIALILLHELGHFTAAKAVGMRVERFMLFFPPIIFKIRRGETEYGVGAIPLGGYVRITGMNPSEKLSPEVAQRAYYGQPVWKRIVVIAAGPAVNLIVAFLILFFLILSQGTFESTTAVAKVQAGQPAVGLLQPGDRIVSVDGKRGGQETIAKTVNKHRCSGAQRADCRAATAAEIKVVRDGKHETVEIYPRYDAELKRMRVGFEFKVVHRSVGIGGAAEQSVSVMWEVTARTVGVIGKIFDAEERKQLSGPVGNYEVTRQAFDVDTVQAIFILALISLSLGVVNLFPFLPLDGGHIFWAIIEKLRRGKPVPFWVMERSGMVGFALVLMLFFIGLTNDINRLTGGEGFGIK